MRLWDFDERALLHSSATVSQKVAIRERTKIDLFIPFASKFVF
jgi:hypothetical protein